MDLGFGSANQALGDATARALLAGTKAQEDALDDELRRMNRVIEDANDDTLESLREKRLQQLKKSQQQKQVWKQNGHGVYSELCEGQHGGDTAKAFFDAAKVSERMVVHFYRPTTKICDIFHAHLSRLAQQHLETRFVKINVEQCETGGSGASFLVERLNIHIIPTLVVVKNRQATHHMHGFDDLGGSDDFSTQTLGYVLSTHGALTARDDEVPPDETAEGRSSTSAIRGMLGGYNKNMALRSGLYDEDFDDDE